MNDKFRIKICARIENMLTREFGFTRIMSDQMPDHRIFGKENAMASLNMNEATTKVCDGKECTNCVSLHSLRNVLCNIRDNKPMLQYRSY